MTPTNGQLRIAIAEVLGWKHIKNDIGLARKNCTNSFDGLVGISPIVQRMEHGQDESKDYNYWIIPNWPESLDACHEMEATLTDDEYHTGYKQTLATIVGLSGSMRMPSATALQRCLAFLRVKRPEMLQQKD